MPAPLWEEAKSYLQQLNPGKPLTTEELNAAMDYMANIPRGQRPSYGGANGMVANMGGGPTPLIPTDLMAPEVVPPRGFGAIFGNATGGPNDTFAQAPPPDVLQPQTGSDIQVSDLDDKKALNALASPKRTGAPRHSSAPGPVAKNAPARDARSVRAQADRTSVPPPERGSGGVPASPGNAPDVPGGAPPGNQEQLDPITSLMTAAREGFIDRARGANDRWSQRFADANDRWAGRAQAVGNAMFPPDAATTATAQAAPVGYGNQPGAMQPQQSMAPPVTQPIGAQQLAQSIANPADPIGALLERAGGANERWAGRFPQVADALGQAKEFMRPGMESLGTDIQGQLASPHLPTIPPQVQALIDQLRQSNGAGRTALASPNPSSMGIKKRKTQRTSQGNQGSRGKRGE